jgi:hypothetical protein
VNESRKTAMVDKEQGTEGGPPGDDAENEERAKEKRNMP